MFNVIQDYTLNLLPPKKKNSQSGWTSFNAVCCKYNGESTDTRDRGGLITNPDGGISYHCFNCQFKTSFTPGRPLSFKFRKFLSWLGADKNEIQRLVFEALRIKSLISPEDIKEIEEPIEFAERSLPAEAQSFMAIAEFYHLADKNFPREFVSAVDYVYQRKIDMQQYEFYWSPEVENKLSHRVIIPFYYQKKIVGYTARTFVDGIQPKYHSDHPSQFVFNLDKQHYDNKFVIVCEGAFDAMAVDGIAVLSNNISEQQAELIEALGKKVIVVPDFDRHENKQGKQVWPGRQLIKCAIDYGWSVSFPVWAEQVKDIADALVKYGKLFVIKTILEASESNPVKIQLISKKYE
jgi:hypothetical protein